MDARAHPHRGGAETARARARGWRRTSIFPAHTPAGHDAGSVSPEDGAPQSLQTHPRRIDGSDLCPARIYCWLAQRLKDSWRCESIRWSIRARETTSQGTMVRLPSHGFLRLRICWIRAGFAKRRVAFQGHENDWIMGQSQENLGQVKKIWGEIESSLKISFKITSFVAIVASSLAILASFVANLDNLLDLTVSSILEWIFIDVFWWIAIVATTIATELFFVILLIVLIEHGSREEKNKLVGRYTVTRSAMH